MRFIRNIEATRPPAVMAERSRPLPNAPTLRMSMAKVGRTTANSASSTKFSIVAMDERARMALLPMMILAVAQLRRGMSIRMPPKVRSAPSMRLA